MGSGIRGNFGRTKGASLAATISNEKIIVKGSSPNNNLKVLKSNYTYNTKTGKFGDKSKNCQTIKSTNPIDDSQHFFKQISKGGITSKLSNGKGYRTDFSDGSVITHRIKTSTFGSPAVDIKIKNHSNGEITTQKIHFIKEDKK